MNKDEAALFQDKKIGFFIFLSVEAVMFATLFANYFIFTPASTGPHPSELFDAKTVIATSFFLLSSSGTLWYSERALESGKAGAMHIALGITLLFALIFLGLEINEFNSYVSQGYGTSASVFLGAFYVLVGLHAAHVTYGAIWMILLFIQYRKQIPRTLFQEKYKIFSYYWHFVDVIWVFIIAIVYVPYLV
jgi:cytochrome c oxidase subunit 3/cytochrome aa3-600 menaquinol oxidase subunit 3